MGRTYSFRANGSGAARYVERIAHQTGKSKAEIIRRCILLAEQANLYDEDTPGAPVDTNASESADVVGAGEGDTDRPAGGMFADSLPRVEEGDSEEEGADARPQELPGDDGDEAPRGREGKSFLSKLFS